MINLVHAKKAQSLVSEQEYRQLLHQYTSLTDDVRLRCAKNAYKLQSEVIAKYPSNISLLVLMQESSVPNQDSWQYVFEQQLRDKQWQFPLDYIQECDIYLIGQL